VSIQRLQAHWGFTKMPFGRSLAPSMLHRHGTHAEAVARIGWCIEQHALGVITGEVGAGKTVAVRAATAALDTSRHVVIYLPNPSVGVRGMLHHVVSALGQVPSFYTATLVPQAADALAAEHTERGRTPVVIFDEAHLLDNAQMEAVRMLTLCRGRGYAGSVARPGGFSLLGGARPLAHLGIITGFRGTRGACPVAGSDRAWCSPARCGQARVP
jgi:type II secretory pathway predicted ATPase ExeA